MTACGLFFEFPILTHHFIRSGAQPRRIAIVAWRHPFVIRELPALTLHRHLSESRFERDAMFENERLILQLSEGLLSRRHDRHSVIMRNPYTRRRNITAW